MDFFLMEFHVSRIPGGNPGTDAITGFCRSLHYRGFKNPSN